MGLVGIGVFITQIFVYPRFARSMGIVRSFSFVTLLSVVTTVLLPLITSLPYTNIESSADLKYTELASWVFPVVVVIIVSVCFFDLFLQINCNN